MRITMGMTTLTESEHTRISDAVREAEANTSGEIVAYLMESSDAYGVAYLRAMLVCSITAVLLGLLLPLSTDGWGMGWLETAHGIVTVALAGGVFGILLTALFPAVRRAFAGRARLARSTALQAHRAFVEEEVFSTRDRTGILLFVSLQEHRVEVLADKGINSVVDAGVWTEVVDLIIDGIRKKSLTDGLVEGITRCGEILRSHGVEVRPSDADELPNELRIRRKP